jgi:hypothetical protein
MLAAAHSAIGQNAHPSSTAFHWLNSSKDATLFERIKTAFADELKRTRLQVSDIPTNQDLTQESVPIPLMAGESGFIYPQFFEGLGKFSHLSERG